MRALLKKLNQKLPNIFLLGSFLVVLGILLLASPQGSVLAVLLFFPALYVFLVSLTVFIGKLLKGSKLSRVAIYKVAIIEAGLVIGVMFFTAQSLRLVDAVVIALITAGALFYLTHRF